MKSATVYMDVVSDRVRECVVRCAQRQFPSVSIIPCERGLISSWHERSSGRAEPQQQGFTCYVTEHKTLADADVSYAVFNARIPLLTLMPCEALSPLMVTPPASVSSNSDAVTTESLIESFFTFPEAQGRVIVVEGGDGAGKETQAGLLVRHLKADGKQVATLDFPHDEGLYGGLIRVVLSGKKGSISQLDTGLFSFIYALNRYGCLPHLSNWITRGFTVVLDRYYTANFGHQASKLPVAERKTFIEHLERVEVNWLQLPRASQVFYLDLPPKAALDAMKNDSTRRYLDIHETAGGDYKQRVRQTYLWCCAELEGWARVACCDDDGRRRTREEVHEMLYAGVHE